MTIGVAEEAVGATNTLGKKFTSFIGTNGPTAATAASKATPRARTSHPYIVGLTLVMIGGLGLVGSITGTLPSMLAALFVPNALVDTTGHTPSILSDVINAGSTATDLLNPLNVPSEVGGVFGINIPKIPSPISIVQDIWNHL